MNDWSEKWLEVDMNPHTRQQMIDLVKSGETERIEASCSKRIAFGTAGLRSSMAAGFAHMNDVTVIQASQGLIKYLQKDSHVLSKSIVVGHDHRHHSQRFAELTASVALLAGFKVYYLGSKQCLSKESIEMSKTKSSLFSPSVDPKEGTVHTPMVPFTIDQYAAGGGVMITASHNPAKDNGYKVYYQNGCQIVPPLDEGIAKQIDENLQPWEGIWDVVKIFEQGIETGNLINVHHKSQDEYIDKLKESIQYDHINFDFVYTPIHGVGQSIFNRVYSQLFKESSPHAFPVREQMIPDPDFPSVTFPNPEEKGALDLAIETAERQGIKLVISNDPDADRFSVAVKTIDNKWYQLTGNEIGFLFAMWIIDKYKSNDLSKLYLVNSTVSSQILKAMAEKHNFNYEDTLTGFKWIGTKAIELKREGFDVPFGYEEAIGYMFNSVTDKDGIAAIVIWLQMYQEWFSEDSSFNPIDKINEGYELYGWFKECNGYYKLDDLRKTTTIFKFIREQYTPQDQPYPNFIGDLKVKSWRDLTIGYDSATHNHQPKLHVDANNEMITVEGELQGENVRFTCRGSGTEPKLKVYIEAKAASGSKAQDVANNCWKILKEQWFQPEKNGLQEVMN